MCAAVLAAIVVALAGATSADATAGAPITLSSSGSNPQVAVDPAGTAHFVWDATGGADQLDYCEIPLGASACTDYLQFPTDDEGNARVLLGPAADEVVIVDTGLNGTAADVWVSMDGGQSFSAGPNGTAGVVGGGFTTQGGTDADRFTDNQQPVFGPGGFSVSWMDGDGYFENFPDDTGPAVNSEQPPSTSQDTQLFTDCGYPDPNSIALLNNTTPVAACLDSSSGTVRYRVATGQGQLNDVSTGSWGPEQSVPGASDADNAQVVGGSRGVYLLYNAPDESLDVRGLVNGTFGAPIVIAQHTYLTGAYEDPTGNLYAVTQDTGTGATGLQQRVFTSPDSVHWTEVPLNLTGIDVSSRNAHSQIAGCAAAAGGVATGSGFVVFNSVSSSAPTTIYAEAFGNSPCGAFQGTSNCPTHLPVGEAQLIATSGCFAAGANGTYATDGPVELNGMMINAAPGAGTNLARARAATATQLVIDTVNRTLSTGSASVPVAASSVTLANQPLDWLIPGTPGPIMNLSDHGEPVSFTPSSIGSTVLGFTVAGQVTPTLAANGMASLPVNVVMPSPIGAVVGPAPTDNLALTAGNSIPGGLSLSPGSVDINIPTVSLGLATLSPFHLAYDSDPEVFDGDIGLQLPVIGGFDLAFEFQQGHFVYGKADLDLGMSVPLFTDVYLQKVDVFVAGKRGNVCANPPTMSDGPTAFGGGLTVAAGPILDGTALLSVDGNASYTFPEASCHQPGVFSITGDGKILGYDVANANLTFTTDGNADIGASVSVGNDILGASASFNGALKLSSPAGFLISADAEVHIAGIKFGPTFWISNLGFEGCVSPLGYIEYNWVTRDLSGGLLSSCDVTDITPDGLSASARAAGGPITVRVPHGVPVEGILLKAASGAPLVSLAGPGGEHVVTPAVAAGAPAALTTTAAADIAVAPSEGGTYIKLLHPRAGTWTITPLPGSPPITSVGQAKGLPAVHVRAHVVAGSGRVRYLVYHNTPAPGRTIRLIESGRGDVMSTIGVVTHAKGRIRFRPAAGPGGRRQIIAQVSERGIPDGPALRLASYTAPGPLKLTRPAHVTVTRRGSQIVIAWHRVPGAARYVVRAVLKDGRSLLFLPSHGTHRLTIAAVPGFDAGMVMVAALSAGNQPGPIGTVKLSALKPTCMKPRAVAGKLVCAPIRHKPKHKKHRTHHRHR